MTVPLIRILFPAAGLGRHQDLIRSIGEASQERHRWDLEVATDTSPEAFGERQRLAPCQGVMALATSTFWGGPLHQLGVPTLALLIPDGDLPVIKPDDHAVGRLAAEHLVRPGWQPLAVYDYDTAWWRERYAGWCSAVPGGPVAQLASSDPENLAWIRGLPTGTALFASHDHVGLRLVRLAHLAGRRVGRDLRILGVDDDLGGLMTSPPLSSIALPMRTLGRVAVRTMAALLAGKEVPACQVSAPLGVVVRGSSDPLVEAPEWIRDLALDLRAQIASGRRPEIGPLLKRQGRHRATINRAWREALGCSVMDYLQEVRRELARIRLADGAGDPDAVAKSLGLASGRSLRRLLTGP